MTEDLPPVAVMERPPMPKKRTTKPAPAASPELKTTVISLKGSNEWRDWVTRMAKFFRTDTAKLVDAALIEYGRKNGFTEEAPER